MDYHIKTIKSWLGTGSLNFFGVPFAGKDTQGKIFADFFDGALISSGDVLRHSHGNQELQDIMAKGGIVPSELFEKVLVPYLLHDEFHGKPLILSEVGRVKGEDQMIMRVTNNTNHPTKAVILLKLSDDEIWRRFDESQAHHDRGNRADDNRAVLQTRLDKYHKMVEPVIEFYRQQDLLIEVDGSKPKVEVTQEIIDQLFNRASS